MASCTRGESHGAAFDFRLKQSTGGATQKGQVQPRQLKEKQPTPFPRCGVENTCTIVHLPFSASMAGGRISFGLPLFHSKPRTHPPTTPGTGILFPSSWAFQEAQRGLASGLDNAQQPLHSTPQNAFRSSPSRRKPRGRREEESGACEPRGAQPGSRKAGLLLLASPPGLHPGHLAEALQ